MNIIERIKKFDLPLGEYAVFGSALLDVWGLREAKDLDIIVTPKLYEQLKNEGWEENQGNGFTMLIKEDASVTTTQERPTDGDYYPDRIQLINDAEIISEIPFVRVEEVIACKKAYNRSKDVEDIGLIERYLTGR